MIGGAKGQSRFRFGPRFSLMLMSMAMVKSCRLRGEEVVMN